MYPCSGPPSSLTTPPRAPARRPLAGIAAIVIVWACGACGPETTSFRATDKTADATSDTKRPGPPAAAYDVRMADQPIAEVHVWSNGGYVSTGDEPMTHVGFEIRNASALPIVFDGDALTLTVFDRAAAALPATRVTSAEPLSPAQRTIQPGAILLLGAYFAIPIRPRAVERMVVQWALRAGDQRYLQVTRFARDDDGSVVAPHPIEARHP
jgi:hypothetical protein